MPWKFISKQVTPPNSTPANIRSDNFISECLQILDSTTTGTAIYILSSLCPEDFATILDLLRFDLGQPHRHPRLSETRVHDKSSTYTRVIKDLQAYANTLPQEVYRLMWLELAERWLLTCPMNPEFYLENETGKELFCQKLRNDLMDRILNIT